MARPAVAPSQLRPVDFIHSVYNLVLAVLWGSCLGRSPLAPCLAGVHLAAAGLPILLRHAPERMPRPLTALREYYPLLFVIGYWFELPPLIPLLHSSTHDAAIFRLESSFNAAMWSARSPVQSAHPLLNEVMYFFYSSYLPLLLLTPAILGVVRRKDILRDFAFRFSLVATVCFTIYLAWPVAGPTFVAGDLAPVTGAFSGGMKVMESFGDVRGSSFPSSHVAFSVTIAFIGWRWLPQILGLLLWALIATIAFACVYTRNHYVVDVVAGVALAVGLHVLTVFARKTFLLKT